MCLENLVQRPDCAFKEGSWEASLGVNKRVYFFSCRQQLLQSAVWGVSFLRARRPSCHQHSAPLGNQVQPPEPSIVLRGMLWRGQARGQEVRQAVAALAVCSVLCSWCPVPGDAPASCCRLLGSWCHFLSR